MHTIISRTRPLAIKSSPEIDFKLDEIEDEENVVPSFIIEIQSRDSNESFIQKSRKTAERKPTALAENVKKMASLSFANQKLDSLPL